MVLIRLFEQCMMILMQFNAFSKFTHKAKELKDAEKELEKTNVEIQKLQKKKAELQQKIESLKQTIKDESMKKLTSLDWEKGTSILQQQHLI